MKAAIFANGDVNDYDFLKQIVKKYDYIIACDGGLHHCHRLSIRPNHIIGDFDSVSAEILEYYQNVPVTRFIPEKDFTDLELAIDHANKIKATELDLLGGFGGRFDHQLANVHVLTQAKMPITMRDETTCLRIVDSSCELSVNDGVLVTLLPFTHIVEGITTVGLKYPLNGESLQIGYARGVSNEIVDELAEVCVRVGKLVVVQIK